MPLRRGATGLWVMLGPFLEGEREPDRGEIERRGGDGLLTAAEEWSTRGGDEYECVRPRDRERDGIGKKCKLRSQWSWGAVR